MRGKCVFAVRGATAGVGLGRAIVRSARSGRLWNSERGGGNAAPWLPQVLLYLCPLLNRFLLLSVQRWLSQFGCFVR